MSVIENSILDDVDPFEGLTADNVEAELKKHKLIEENYISDDEDQVRFKLVKLKL